MQGIGRRDRLVRLANAARRTSSLCISDHGFQSVTRTIGSEDSSVSDAEADEMEEHLRGLGYLE